MLVAVRGGVKLALLFCALTLCAAFVCAQSTATIQGTVTDTTGSAIPGATITVHNIGTGQERTTQTDSTGLYVVPSLPPGTYSVQAKSQGMQNMLANNLVVQVGTTTRQDFTMEVAAASQTIEISAAAPVVESNTVTVGGVVNQTTVQEIPLNGRHFVDLALLVAGTVTPPQNGFLTAPLRGQGSFGLNTAGAREDQVNYMINGINLSDPVQNQITFQPTINTVQEFKMDNSTYSAQYGRNSGAIMNIATRSGTNQWHGDAYEYLRNNDLDARNFANPAGVLMAPFKRNQFSADGGGPIIKDRTFFFLSYEGTRQRQSIPINTPVLSDAQRAQAQASSDPVIQKLLPLIPAPNSQPGNLFVSSAVAPVNIDQGTVNFSHNFSNDNRLNIYYALQHDFRGEPTLQGNNLPDFGDQREARRQIMTVVDTQVLSPSLVNEVRLGYNRIHIVFNPLNTLNAADYGISSGVTGPIGLPQIRVTNAFSFGGVSGFPQGRGDYSAGLSDTLNWVHGGHSIAIGGEYRRLDNNNFALTPGLFTFPNIAAFLADQANGFSVNTSNGASRIYVNSIGAFVEDTWKISPRFTAILGMRYDWYGTPTEAGGRFVVFDPTTDSLIHQNQPYNQSALNFQPRIGLAWDVFGNGRTILRTAYAIMTDQPIIGLVTALANNPPNALPVNFSPSAATPYVSFANAYAAAGGIVSPRSIAHNYKDSYAQEYNFNIQEQLVNNFGLMVGYFGSKGTDLNIIRNYNQLVNGVKPYARLSASSPIMPGTPLGTILVQESDGNSNYNALWVTLTKRFASGLQFNTSYSFSKSIDYNSRNNQGLVVQDSYNIRGDRGLSDFDARHRWSFDGVYQLPWKANRLVSGWQLSSIIQLQSGNPINFFTTNAAFTGTATLRPSVIGPVQTGFSPARNGNATFVSYIQNPSVFYNPGNAFGNLGRNVVIGPGFSDVDVSLEKDTKIVERFTWILRVDAFDVLNHPNFGQPVSTIAAAPGSTFGLISGTRFPPGDGGSSRQLQVMMGFTF